MTLDCFSLCNGKTLLDDALERRAMRGVHGNILTDADVGLNALRYTRATMEMH